jgi:hypothetical protein
MAGVSLAAPERVVEPRTAEPGPVLVELVGPAGAGKTAVLQALRRQSAGIQAGLRIDRVRSFPVITWQVISIGSAGLGLVWRAGRSWRSCLQHLLRLRTLRTLLEPHRIRGDRAVVLDEGPVFSLCRLLLFQHHRDDPRPKELVQEVAGWAGRMDLLVWLDAPNPVLARRIRDRLKGHEVKEGSAAEIDRFLNRFRDAYREIMTRLVSGGHPAVLEFRTEASAPEQIAATILATIERLQRGRTAPPAR